MSIVRLLVEAGANREAKDIKLGYTALLLASMKGHAAIAQLLQEAEANEDA